MPRTRTRNTAEFSETVPDFDIQQEEENDDKRSSNSNSDDRKQSNGRNDDSKQTDHDDSDAKQAKFGYNHPGIEPKPDYVELVSSNIQTLGSHKVLAGAREEWQATSKAFDDGEILATDAKGRGPFGLMKSSMRKQVEHIAESFADISHTLEYDDKKRHEAAYAVTDRMMAKQLGQTEYAEAQAAYKPGAGATSDTNNSRDVTKYLHPEEKQILLDFHNKCVNCMDRAADPNDNYSHKDASKDISNTLEKATNYMIKKGVINKDGTVAESRVLNHRISELETENAHLRDNSASFRTDPTFDPSVTFMPEQPDFNTGHKETPTGGEHVEAFASGYSKTAAQAYEDGYKALADMFENDSTTDKAKEIYAEQVISMMSGNISDQAIANGISPDESIAEVPTTDHGKQFRDIYNYATYGAYEDRLISVLAIGEQTDDWSLGVKDDWATGATGPEAYNAFRDELRENTAFLNRIQDVEYSGPDLTKYDITEIRDIAIESHPDVKEIANHNPAAGEIAEYLLRQTEEYVELGYLAGAQEHLTAYAKIANYCHEQSPDPSTSSPFNDMAQYIHETNQSNKDFEANFTPDPPPKPETGYPLLTSQSAIA